jgi:hypothetical protein
MAAPKLTPGKKRYSVSLTEMNVRRFQSLAKAMGLPSPAMSNLFDMALLETSDLLQIQQEKGTITITDLYKFTGQQLELVIEEERRKNDEQKREKTSGGSKVAKRGNKS